MRNDLKAEIAHVALHTNLIKGLLGLTNPCEMYIKIDEQGDL